MNKVKVTKNKRSRQVDFIDPMEKMDPLINKSNKRTRRQFNEQIDLSTMNTGSFEKATDVDENDSYIGLTPKTPKDENYYVYANASHSHNVSTPGTVVSDFELDRLELEDVEHSYEKEKTDSKLITLAEDTKNNLLNETMLFMTLENEKLKKMKKLKYELEQKTRIYESLKKLLMNKKEIKIPPHLLEKYHHIGLDESTYSIVVNNGKTRKESMAKAVSPMTDISKKAPKLSIANQRKNSSTSNSSASVNSALASNAYIRGSGIVGRDSFDKLIYKRSDGILINLKCSLCSKDDFVSPQGIINHYRFKHGGKQYGNQNECILDNMEYYDLLQSSKILEKFKELKIDPKKSYLNYNVAFTDSLDLKTETVESLDSKVEFIKTLSFKKKGMVASSGNTDTTNTSRKNTENEKENIIQVISLDNNHLKKYVSAKSGNPQVVDEVNDFILNFEPTDMETPNVVADNHKEVIESEGKTVKRRKLNQGSVDISVLPERRSKRKVSIPKRLLD